MDQHRSFLRPGMSLDIIYENRHLKAMIYDVINRRIIIAQTTPPLTKQHLNRNMDLTFVVKKDGKPVRYGLKAKVTDFILNYKLATSDVAAIGLEQRTKLETYNLRMDFRVHPPTRSNISIEWYGEKLNLIDISVGGFQFSYHGLRLPEVNEIIKIALIIGESFLAMPAQIMRISTPVANKPNLHHVGVKFLGNSRNYERILMKELLEIQRKLLMEGRLA